MGQNLCSNTSSIEGQLKESFLDFQFGQDTKEGKIQHMENVKCKNINGLQKILDQCVQKLKISKLMYKDPTMPTDKLILKSISKQNNQQKQIEAVFVRPYKFLNDVQKGKPYKIFPNNDSNCDYILVKDEVMQYFGVFLCFLANHPKIISDLIITQSNSFGIVVVKMIVNGKQQLIYMDDYMLCTEDRPLFVQPIKNIYLWPNILQKAWLKITGFTEKIIEKSSPEEVFESFFFYPYKKFPLQELTQTEIKSYLNKYLYFPEKDFGCILTTKKDPKIHIGISGKKYLYLIGSFTFEARRLFLVRNPCGKFNFRGQYDQINENLKNKIKETFKIFSVQQGNFILQESQFIEQIAEFAICYYSPILKPTSHAIQLENNSEIFVQTQLKSTSNISLCFRQQGIRKSQSKFSPISYQVFNMTTGQIVAGQENNEGCFGLHNAYLFPEVIKKLPQSKYLIRLKKKDKKRHYFGIDSMLIACCVNQLRFDIKNQEQFEQLFKQFLKKQGKKSLNENNARNQASKNANINPIQYSVFMVGDLICIYIEYVSPKGQQFKIEISFPELKNLEIIYPLIDLKQTSVLPKSLGPQNKEEILVFEKIDLTAETQLGDFQLQAF